MKILINIANQWDENSCPEIGGEVFPIGEWKHVDDAWCDKEADKLQQYPAIKEAHVVRDEMIAKAFEDYNIYQFDQGLKDSYAQYGKVVSTLADAVTAVALKREAAI